MKVKTADLIGPALDWAVAKCEAVEVEYINDGITRCILRVSPFTGMYRPSVDWAIGGPLIERESITLRVNACVPSRWVAFIDFGGSNCNIKARQSGPTPLIAAMRCVVAANLGDEVDVPDELV